MALLFEWDPRKAERNLRIHGVSFDEAGTAFHDPLSSTIDDPLHSEDEERYVLLGRSYQGHLLVVVHTERGDRISLISARLATGAERKKYEEESTRP
jgi:uncharacterized DUF497 family protein